MIVLMLEKVPASLRGELTRWMVEPKTGVFVGRVSAQVRDLLWEGICDRLKGGGGILIYQSDSEQGYRVKTCGNTKREAVNCEGLTLMRIPAAREESESTTS